MGEDGRASSKEGNLSRGAVFEEDSEGVTIVLGGDCKFEWRMDKRRPVPVTVVVLILLLVYCNYVGESELDKLFHMAVWKGSLSRFAVFWLPWDTHVAINQDSKVLSEQRLYLKKIGMPESYSFEPVI
jgi:hypothetical protein